MIDPAPGNLFQGSATGSTMSVSRAKARLLEWSRESDARREAHKPDKRVIALVAAIAALGGIAILRVLRPRSGARVVGAAAGFTGIRVVRWALLARAAAWLLPVVLRSVKRPMQLKNSP